MTSQVVYPDGQSVALLGEGETVNLQEGGAVSSTCDPSKIPENSSNKGVTLSPAPGDDNPEDNNPNTSICTDNTESTAKSGKKDKKPPTRYRWLMIAMFCACNAALYLDRANFSTAVVYMYHENSPVKYKVVGAFFWGYPILQVIGGMLASK